MLDAFDALVSNACVPASLLQCRAMFESSVHIDFALLGNTEEKARYFYVANVRRELAWALRSQAGSTERERFFEALGDFGESLQQTFAAATEPIEKQINDARAFLSREPWSAVNAGLERAKGKKKHDVSWYVPLGSGSLRDLCRLTKRLHEYEIFYSAASEKMHGSEYKSHVTFGDGQISFQPFRSLENIKSTLHWALSIALHSYRRVLECYRPGQLEEFARRYVQHWRDGFLNIKSIVYSVRQDDALSM